MASESQRRVALVTGGTRGIGLAICRELADDYHLLVGGRDQSRVDEVVASLPSAEGFCVDLCDVDALRAAVAGINHLDALIHNAGITKMGAIGDVDHDTWLEVLTMNVVAVADLTRECLPLLRQSRGCVVAINSGSGFTSKPTNGVYSASKHALVALTDALREEERGRVKVVSIHPGRVDTDMQVECQQFYGRQYRPEEHMRPESVARAVSFALSMGDDATIDYLAVRPTAG